MGPESDSSRTRRATAAGMHCHFSLAPESASAGCTAASEWLARKSLVALCSSSYLRLPLLLKRIASFAFECDGILIAIEGTSQRNRSTTIDVQRNFFSFFWIAW